MTRVRLNILKVMLGTALRGILHQPTTRKAELAELNDINWSTIVRDTRDCLISIR